ncbi:MAG: hypothetical protein IJZ76_05930 [Lachnospiraceae bacterium]|nr:hypothetical protein [Lachnospiraceae bacterium]
MFLSQVEQFDYLKALGQETASVVKEQFTEGSNLGVYEGDDTPSLKNDAEFLAGYMKAIDVTKTWLRAVLAAEVVGDAREDTEAIVKLILPDRELEESIYVYTDMPPIKEGEYCDMPEMLQTPIGEMDWFTYRMIVDVPVNPVKELYCYFADLIHQMHNIIIMPNHRDGDDNLLSEEILEEEGIIDVLGVHSFDAMWYSLRDDFFTDKFASVKEVGV